MIAWSLEAVFTFQAQPIQGRYVIDFVRLLQVDSHDHPLGLMQS